MGFSPTTVTMIARGRVGRPSSHSSAQRPVSLMVPATWSDRAPPCVVELS